MSLLTENFNFIPLVRGEFQNPSPVLSEGNTPVSSALSPASMGLSSGSWIVGGGGSGEGERVRA